MLYFPYSIGALAADTLTALALELTASVLAALVGNIGSFGIGMQHQNFVEEIIELIHSMVHEAL